MSAGASAEVAASKSLKRKREEGRAGEEHGRTEEEQHDDNKRKAGSAVTPSARSPSTPTAARHCPSASSQPSVPVASSSQPALLIGAAGQSYPQPTAAHTALHCTPPLHSLRSSTSASPRIDEQLSLQFLSRLTLFLLSVSRGSVACFLFCLSRCCCHPSSAAARRPCDCHLVSSFEPRRALRPLSSGRVFLAGCSRRGPH